MTLYAENNFNWIKLVINYIKDCELINFAEPNNDSPLNASAASLWENQKEYKKVLMAKYQNIS